MFYSVYFAASYIISGSNILTRMWVHKFSLSYLCLNHGVKFRVAVCLSLFYRARLWYAFATVCNFTVRSKVKSEH